MPLYEYECRACHKRTEKIQKFSDPEITICPFCSGELERTITAPAFQFSGGGWYKDGYGSVKPPASGAGDAPSTGAESAPATATTGGGDGATATPAPGPAAPAAVTAPASTAPAKS